MTANTPAVADRQVPKYLVKLDQAMPSIATSLPEHITTEKFRQVAATAISRAPMLRECMESNPAKVLTALADCASDGLLPNNRQAALVPFKNRQTNTIDLTYIPMIAGVLTRMRNSGEVLLITARVVYANDEFKVVYGDDEKIEHTPTMDDPGDPVAAYAIIKLKSGEVHREIMPKRDIDKVMRASRSGQKGPWGSWWEEMARKTVLKRAAKYCPFSESVMTMLDRDNDLYDLRAMERERATEPVRDRFASMREQSRQLTFDVEPAPDDEAPARDISEDLDDHIPAFDAEDETGEDEPQPSEPQEDAEPPTNPATGSASSAPDDEDGFPGDEPATPAADEGQEQAASTQRFYREALSRLSKAKPADKAAVLRKLQDEPFWFDLTKTQAKTLIDAGGVK